MWLEAIREPACDETCPTCGSGVRRRVYGELHGGSQVLNGERVDFRARPDELFSDPISLDPVTQYYSGKLYRVSPQNKYFASGGGLLHRHVWASVFGDIPKSCHIHHRDGNRQNNCITNLECMPISEHTVLSRAQRQPGDEGWFTSEARQSASDWHKSDAGRLWHQRQAHRSKSWEKWKREDKPCEICGTTIKNALIRKGRNGAKYCSISCKSKAYSERQKAKSVG